MCVHAHKHTNAYRSQKVLHLLELEWQAVMSYLLWVLDADFNSSERTESATNCRVISQVSQVNEFIVTL